MKIQPLLKMALCAIASSSAALAEETSEKVREPLTRKSYSGAVATLSEVRLLDSTLPVAGREVQFPLLIRTINYGQAVTWK